MDGLFHGETVLADASATSIDAGMIICEGLYRGWRRGA
jgi:hypothetical protein